MRIRLCLQAAPTDPGSWVSLARRAEGTGFAALTVADHPGSGPAPFVALAAAAAATERIELGSYVVNAGAWEPLALANEVATLDVLSGGRAMLGIGAGHTPAEWTMSGRAYPSAGTRVARMVELTEVTRRLLAGETVTFTGEHVRTVDATLTGPTPRQERIPLLVGGNGRRVLSYAAEHADLVGPSGLGRTLPDGHRHEVDWATSRIADKLALVHAVAASAGRRPRLDALVQVLEVTDDPPRSAAILAERLGGVTAEDLLAAPYVLLGTVEGIVAELRRHRDRWGITRFTVREAAMDAAERIIDALAEPAG